MAEETPFVGRVTADRVNVRARPQLTSEVFFQLPKGFKVYVFKKEGPWYQVRCPEEASVYVAWEYLGWQEGASMAQVKGRGVHLRTGMGAAYASLGVVSDPQSLIPRRRVGEWLEIQPPDSCRGWIHESYVTSTEEEHKGR